MKYLISKNFKVMRKGSHVEASATAGEWIYDTDLAKDVDAGKLQEIAKANKLKVVGKKKSEYTQSLNEALENMTNVPEQNKESQTNIVDKIVSEGFAAGKSDDDMLIAIIQAGVSFQRAGKMFKETVERLGLRVGIKDVKEVAAKLLAEIDFSPKSYAEVREVADKIVAQCEGAQQGQALAAIKAYAKEKEITLPKKEKGQRGAIGFRGKFYDWVVANPTAGEDELVAFLKKEGKDETKLVKRFLPIIQLCQRFAKAQAAAAGEAKAA